VNAKQQVEITLRFQPGPAKWFKNLREYLQDLIRHNPKDNKLIAADMDIAPSDLSRKLAENPNDSRRLTVGDVETYMETQLDYSPIYFWIEKYLLPRNDDEIRAQIKRLQTMLDESIEESNTKKRSQRG
jgi:hypothetical protein